MRRGKGGNRQGNGLLLGCGNPPGTLWRATPEMNVESFAATHVGLTKQRNDDAAMAHSIHGGQGKGGSWMLLAVADGMGGHRGGDVASRLALEVLRELRPTPGHEEAALEAQVYAAGEAIRDKARADANLGGMGTTLTAALVRGRNAWWAHVGDSRLYLLRGGVLEQITRDHTFVQDMLDSGGMTEKEAELHPMRNLLDQCVGVAPFRADVGHMTLRGGDVLLVCSDGVHKDVPLERVAGILSREAPLQVRGNALVQAALDVGGFDNIGVAILDVPHAD